jgi:hypothetical protein
MRWARDVARIRKKRKHIGFGGRARRKETTTEGLDAGGRMILKMDLREMRWIVWTGFIWLRIGTSCSNEPSGSIKRWEILE